MPVLILFILIALLIWTLLPQHEGPSSSDWADRDFQAPGRR